MDEILALGIIREPAPDQPPNPPAEENDPLPEGDDADTDPLPRESTGSTTSDSLAQNVYKRNDKTYIGHLVELQEKMMAQDKGLQEKEDQHHFRQQLFMDSVEQFMHQYVELKQEKRQLEERKLALMERRLDLLERELRLKYPRLESPGMSCEVL